jgi:hypothetical protein
VLEENYLWGYDRQRQLIMKVERSKNRLYYLDLDRVDPICDGFLVEEQRSVLFPRESTHVMQDIICESQQTVQSEESPASSRPPWPEEGGLKENSSSEKAPLKGLARRKAGYTCMELLNIAVASIIQNRTNRTPWSNCSPAFGSPEEKSNPAETGAPDGMEASVPTKNNQPRYACLELIDLAVRETNIASWPKNQVPSLAGVESHLTNESVSVLAGASTLPTHGGMEDEETSATSSAEEYVILAPIAQEARQVRPTQACMGRMLDLIVWERINLY